MQIEFARQSPGTRRRRTSMSLLTGLCTGALLTCAGCGAAQEPPAAARPVPASPTSTKAPVPAPALSLRVSASARQGRQDGSAPVHISETTIDGGHIATTAGPGRGLAYLFPRYVAVGPYPRAVLTVVGNDDSPGDQLQPDRRSFTYGADFRVEDPSEGRANDNGNNIIQRGLFNEPVFYKAEVDGGRPSCSVKGDRGVVTVRTPHPVRPNAWYRIRCDRDGDYVTVRVWRLGPGGGSGALSAVNVGKVGRVRLPSRAIPLAIGGKVAPNGAIIKSATDQFNGAIANPMVQVYPSSR